MMVSGRKMFYVYIMTNHSGTLYVGVTSNIQRRVGEHKLGLMDGFTKKYQINRLVYYEETGDVQTALEREKQIKGWARKKKIGLIETMNPGWIDLGADW